MLILYKRKNSEYQSEVTNHVFSIPKARCWLQLMVHHHLPSLAACYPHTRTESNLNAPAGGEGSGSLMWAPCILFSYSDRAFQQKSIWHYFFF